MEKPNIIITIPEPCHEDWNKMLPDDKGKFCNSCNKSVFDFSNKTDNEIKEVLMAYKDQKVCGHFKRTQINRPLNITIDLKDLPKNMSITKMFTVALFLAFGTFLFSCTDNLGKAVGEISVVEHIKDQKEDIEKMVVLGEIAPPPPDTLQKIENTEETIDGEMEVSTYYETHVAGGISMQQMYPQEIILEKIMPNDSNEIDSPLTNVPKPEEMIVGMMVYVPDVINEEPEKVDSLIKNDVIEKVEKTIDGKTPMDITADFLVFPNPTKGEFSLKYDVKKRSDVLATIIDINGVTLRTVVNVHAQHTGKYQVPVDLSDMTNGIYFVNLTVDGKRRTQKVILQK